MPRTLARVVFSLVILALAGFAAWNLWDLYMREPWTRDARVRAEVVSLAADVSGQVETVAVGDNARVRVGDLLFTIDKARFEIALESAEATVAARQAVLDQARREVEREQRLIDVVPRKDAEDALSARETAEAELRGALTARDAAALDLRRAEVRSPVNGVVSNLSLRPGDHVTAGAPVVAIVDTDTFHVEGYFEETKLGRIRIGAPVTIRLMGRPGTIAGTVESIAAGIEDRERADGAGALANINPSFAWVRLAQRVPVRIALDPGADREGLVSGMTATVVIAP